MIKFSLSCSRDHVFEGWFSSGEEFDRLSVAGHVDCPVCGDRSITKALMAPSVRPSRKRTTSGDAQAGPTAVAAANGSLPGQGVAPVMSGLSDEARRELAGRIREFREQVLAGSEDVGERFSEEARKIHYGEAQERGIYGRARPEEAAELVEEGIPIIPLPALPEDRN